MTREEAIKRLTDIHKFSGLLGLETADKQAVSMGIDALEQEPILDKIIVEIADITDTVEINPESFWNTKLYVRYNDVLNIIDKYRAEN